MDSVLNFILCLAIILFSTKICGLVCRKIGLPQVLGYIIAGILVGPALFGDFFGWSLIDKGRNSFGGLVTLTNENGGMTTLSIFAQIGVLLIMFISGLETDLKELKKTGVVSTVIACIGVAVPMLCGFLVCLPFALSGVLNTESFTFGVVNAVFIGVILTATSCAITVSVLRDLGKLKGRVGTILLSAAIIDDIIGLVVLNIVVGIFGSGDSGGGYIMEAMLAAGAPENLKALYVVILIIGFFAVAIGGGIGVSKLFKYLDKKWPRTHRIPLLSLVVCLVYAYVAEAVFGIAAISGAFLAGLILSPNHRAATYVDQKLDVTAYLIFLPVFFASIGINIDLIGGFSNGWMILMMFIVVIVGLLTKIVGCGAGAMCFKMGKRDSLITGVGMMARGEVALVVTATGVACGLLDNSFYIITVMLILVSAIITPILLKFLYSKQNGDEVVLPVAPLASAVAAQSGVELQNLAQADSGQQNPIQDDSGLHNHRVEMIVDEGALPLVNLEQEVKLSPEIQPEQK